MSKADAQRAMREANYARNNASEPSDSSRREAAAGGDTPSAPAARKASPKLAKAANDAASAPAAQDVRCGHKSMNGRACTREAAHPEKSHRYS